MSSWGTPRNPGGCGWVALAALVVWLALFVTVVLLMAHTAPAPGTGT